MNLWLEYIVMIHIEHYRTGLKSSLCKSTSLLKCFFVFDSRQIEQNNLWQLSYKNKSCAITIISINKEIPTTVDDSLSEFF